MKAPTKAQVWWALTPPWVKLALVVGAVKLIGGR